LLLSIVRYTPSSVEIAAQTCDGTFVTSSSDA